MDPQSLEEGSIGNVSIHDLPGPDPGHELEVLSDLHADLGGEGLEGRPNQQSSISATVYPPYISGIHFGIIAKRKITEGKIAKGNIIKG